MLYPMTDKDGGRATLATCAIESIGWEIGETIETNKKIKGKPIEVVMRFIDDEKSKDFARLRRTKTKQIHDLFNNDNSNARLLHKYLTEIFRLKDDDKVMIKRAKNACSCDIKGFDFNVTSGRFYVNGERFYGTFKAKKYCGVIDNN